MGCDMHWTLEVRHDAKWVGVMNGCGRSGKASDRWYAFFTELAGVRGESETSLPIRGLPDDVSDLTQYDAATSSWDHSGSWCTVDEFVAAYNRAVGKYQPQNPGEKTVSACDLFNFAYWPFGVEDEMRVVFAFDN